MASRVHDSVLQTLALIQRHAEEPQQVAQLARAQERELRSWLFEGQPPGSLADGRGTVADGGAAHPAEVEAAHGVAVETVVVGRLPARRRPDAPCSAAAREATVNAAKWSGADVVSLFAEVEPDRCRCSCGTGARASTRRGPADRRASPSRSRRAWPAAAGSAVIRTAPGRGHRGGADRWPRRSRPGAAPAGPPVQGRRPRVVPGRRPRTCSAPGCGPSWATTSRWSARPTTWPRPSS